jgi:hypothetical protein
MWISPHLKSSLVKLPPEIAEWARQLLAQTRGVLQKAERGEAAVPPADIERLRKTERDLSAVLGPDEE